MDYKFTQQEIEEEIERIKEYEEEQSRRTSMVKTDEQREFEEMLRRSIALNAVAREVYNARKSKTLADIFKQIK